MSKTLVVCLFLIFSFVLLVFSITPAQASVQLSSASLNFGLVNVNTTSASATVVITNDNRHPVDIASLSSSVSQFLVSGISLPLSLSPHSSTAFSVVFQPTAALSYSGVISISFGGHGNGVERISVSGTGVATPTALLSPSTSNLVFGSTSVGISATQAVSLTNTGSGSVIVSSVVISGPGFGVSGFSGAVTLSAGQSLSLLVSFAPPYAGSMTGSLTVSGNAGNSPSVIALSGSGVQSQIAIAPASASFGSVTTGASYSQPLTISNGGTSSLTITQASLSGTGFGYSGLTLPLIIPAGATSPFTVSFAPTGSGTFSGTLTLVNNSATPSVAIPLSGTGVAQTLQLSASPGSLSFGSVLAGSSTTKSVTLANTGSGSVTLSGDTVTGSGFGLSGLSVPLTLNAGQSTSFTVAFAPSASGNVSGSIGIISSAANSPTTITLSGTCVQPQISVTPGSASFGSVTAGVSNTQTLTISNPGTANVTVTQASLSGAGFSYSGLAVPLSVAPGATSPFTVSFAPTGAGTFSGTLTLVNNSATPSLVVPLSGTGAAPVLQLSSAPTSLSFGNITTGTTVANTVTLTNSGNANVSLSQDTVSGSGFSVTGLALPLTLSQGQSTSFSVNFAPTATGTVSGSVSISSNATNSPTSIALSGSGIAPVAHKVTLTWTPSSTSFSGFNVYRSTVSGGPYSKLNSSIVPTATYTDSNVTAGQTYYYVATEVDTTGFESAYSAQTSAAIP